ncbi:hypothetical protein [Azonexus sp.]|uniref:hypothetical protein n=1 Tax=Azonexus sp. TaxID=1872668 RepID=UPI0035AF7354
MKLPQRLLARLLLLIVAASALFPGQLLLACAAEAVPAMHHAAATGHAMTMAQDSAADDCGGCPGEQAPLPCDDAQHLCCPGHLPGYPPAVAGETPAVPVGIRLIADRRLDDFSSRVPEGLERPPRPVTA